MSVNRHKAHAFILPEDDAYREIGNGFQLGLSTRQVHVLRPARGWLHVRESFLANHVSGMRAYPQRMMFLLVDFDHVVDRLQEMRSVIPEDLRDRVFVFGAFGEAEDLKSVLGPYETIGKALARDCQNGATVTWGHDLLQHNLEELDHFGASTSSDSSELFI